MPSGNVCWGIELGASAVKAIKLERSGEDVNVLEYAVIPHKKVLSTPDADPTDTLRVSMGQLVSQFDLTGAPIAISVPGHSAFARFAKLPPVEPKKIPDIVKFEAVQQIPFPIDQVEWDYQTFASPDNPDVEVGIFAVMRERVMDILAKWNEVGVTPDYVTIGPVSAYNAVAWDQNFGDKTPGTVILDIGTTATDLIVCEPGRVWVRTFQIGGHQFTEALVNAFKLSYSKAETLKSQAEQSKHARHILQAMRPVFADIAQEVQRSIGYYQSSHRDANLTRLIALGSTFNLPGLRKYLGQQLQMEVIRLEKFNRLSIDGPRGAEFEASTGSLATAYGLALQGLGFNHGIMVNLMPVTIVREGMWKKKTKWFALAAGLSVAGAGVAFFKPLMEKATVPTTRPEVVGQTASRITTLKNQYRTEVESKFKTDYAAANTSLLLTNREVYPYLADDLGQIVAAARTKADEGGKPGEKSAALRFVAFTTDYRAPGGSASPDGMNPPPTAEPGSGPIAVGARIVSQLDITVSSDTENTTPIDKLISSSIVKWLEDHSERSNVPYTIDKASIRWDRKQESAVAAPKPGDSSQPPTSPPPVSDSPGYGGPKGGGGGAGIGSGGFGGPFDQPGVTGTTAPASGGGGQGNANLDAIAPLPPAPPAVEPGKTVVTYKIHFEAVIRDPNKPAESKEGKS